MPTETDRLVTEETAAERLGVKPKTLTTWRCTGRYSLPYVKLGKRAVRYRESDIEKFINENTVGAAD